MTDDREDRDETREIRIIIPKDLAPIWLPKETSYHIREAIRQTLLALRSMMDAGVQYYQDALTEPSKGKRLKKVKVE
ncbi:MAG: hypothetical protein ACE5PO_04330 [Candidatus Bathyarchaeia archaeon]